MFGNEFLVVNDRTKEFCVCTAEKIFDAFIYHKDSFKRREIPYEELKPYIGFIQEDTEAWYRCFTPFFLMAGEWRISYAIAGDENKGTPYLHMEPNVEEAAYNNDFPRWYDKTTSNFYEYALAVLFEDIVKYLDEKNDGKSNV